jgi:hypothetical protein
LLGYSPAGLLEVFYGNHVENVKYLATLTGMKVVMEG